MLKQRNRSRFIPVKLRPQNPNNNWVFAVPWPMLLPYMTRARPSAATNTIDQSWVCHKHSTTTTTQSTYCNQLQYLPKGNHRAIHYYTKLSTTYKREILKTSTKIVTRGNIAITLNFKHKVNVSCCMYIHPKCPNVTQVTTAHYLIQNVYVVLYNRT